MPNTFPIFSAEYVRIGSGSCWNSIGQHPPYEFGTASNNSPESCYQECKTRATARGGRCTGFDVRPGCVYYFDEEVTQPKTASIESEGCYRLLSGILLRMFLNSNQNKNNNMLGKLILLISKDNIKTTFRDLPHFPSIFISKWKLLL